MEDDHLGPRLFESTLLCLDPSGGPSVVCVRARACIFVCARLCIVV